MTALDDLLGIPHRFGGRDAAGMDCYGAALAVCGAHGVPLPDIWEQMRERWESGWRELWEAEAPGWIQVETPADGDVVLCAGHMGAVSGGYVYHSKKGSGLIKTRWREFRRAYAQQNLSVWRWVG